MFNRIYVIPIFIMLAASLFPIHAAWNIKEKDKSVYRTGSRLAIINIINDSSIDKKTAEFLYELVAIEWKNTGIFSIIDPAFTAEILKSQKISPNTTKEDELLNAGRLVHADYVLTGTCRWFGVGDRYVLDVTLYDASTGKKKLSVRRADKDYRKLAMDISGLIKGSDLIKKTQEQIEVIKKVNIQKGSTISIMPFDAIDVESGSARIIGQTIITELNNFKTLKIIESERLDKILNEYEMRQAGLKQGNTEVSISGSSYLMFGTLARFEGSYLLNIRVVSTGTGEIEYTDRKEASSLKQIKNDIPMMLVNMSYLINKNSGN